ncbi:hypothetical protein, partial [Roseisolibacter sp. H3M3-2]|uniref:hypothetical protein n=1 Tax=Roseisolibacter sp. H3M3-2 TaxID=3031323 RepID=UPI0023DCE1AE
IAAPPSGRVTRSHVMTREPPAIASDAAGKAWQTRSGGKMRARSPIRLNELARGVALRLEQIRPRLVARDAELTLKRHGLLAGDAPLRLKCLVN